MGAVDGLFDGRTADTGLLGKSGHGASLATDQIPEVYLADSDLVAADAALLEVAVKRLNVEGR